MVFRNRLQSNLRLRPVNRIKHVFDEQGGIAAGSTVNVSLAETTDTPTLAATNSVETGCTINGIYLKIEINATSSAALANAYMYVAKNPGNNLSMPAPNVVGASDNKKYVIHQEMLMLQQVTNSNPRTLFNGVIALPRGYRRFGPDDLLLLKIQSPGVALNYCVQCHYKEFR